VHFSTEMKMQILKRSPSDASFDELQWTCSTTIVTDSPGSISAPETILHPEGADIVMQLYGWPTTLQWSRTSNSEILRSSSESTANCSAIFRRGVGNVSHSILRTTSGSNPASRKSRKSSEYRRRFV
jgi:hypothetical protein